MNCSGNEDSSNESFATARTSGGHRHHRQSDGGQHSTKQLDTSGLMNTQHHGQFSMHIDDHVSYDGKSIATFVIERPHILNLTLRVRW